MSWEALVIRLYQREIITSAHGARMLGMERLRFERFLAENEIPIHGDPEELDDEIRNLERYWNCPGKNESLELNEIDPTRKSKK